MDRIHVRKVRALIARLGIEEQVDIPGPLDGADLVRRLNASHVFVLPFSFEGFGIACLEAMAWGLPVVGSCEGALKEFVADGINGVLVAPGDIATFAQQIHRLHANRNLLTRCGQAAFDTFRSRPGWKDNLRKIHSFLLSIASQTQIEARA